MTTGPDSVQTIDELRAIVRGVRLSGKRIGCVPTMGALHAGHLSLVEAARRDTAFVVVTVFVNPTQFGPDEDLHRYPRPFEDDLAKCRAAGVDLVFYPNVETVYPRENGAIVEVPELSSLFEGVDRAGHFCGVTTVVLKLLNMVLPDVAYFGQKDYQQQLVIRRMVEDLHIPVEITTCPIVREEDGLALSSRNAYLSPEDRQTGLALSQSLDLAKRLCTSEGKSPREAREQMVEYLKSFAGLELRYATIADPHSLEELDELKSEMVALVAARVGTTRLIDNVLIQS